ncbi:MAG: ATP-binding protein, partial [bacterium]
YMFKPFEVDELLRTMEEIFKKHEDTFKHNGVQHEITFHFQSQFKYLEEVNDLVTHLFKHSNLASDEIWEVKLALHELGINAIEHGNKMDPDKAVRLKCQFFDDRLEFEIEDEGEGFEFTSIPDPTSEPVLTQERGRGIFLVSQVVDEIKCVNNGRCIRLIKYINNHA